jgi:hypothetical protein
MGSSHRWPGRRTRRLRSIGQAFVSVGAILYLFSEGFGLSLVRIIAVLVSGLGIGLSGFVQIVRGAEKEAEIEEKEAEVERIESESGSGLPLGELLKRHIRLAIGREEIGMLRADRRANSLYSIGSTLLVISVLCPVLAAMAYWLIDPLPPDLGPRLAALKDAVGELPGGSTIAVQRDWHLLLGGITFGFLCLAAARGFLAQQSKEIAAFFRLADRVNHYERLESVVEIREYLAQDEGAKRELADLVIGELLSQPDQTDKEEAIAPETLASSADVKEVLQVAKSLRGSA